MHSVCHVLNLFPLIFFLTPPFTILIAYLNHPNGPGRTSGIVISFTVEQEHRMRRIRKLKPILTCVIWI